MLVVLLSMQLLLNSKRNIGEQCMRIHNKFDERHLYHVLWRKGSLGNLENRLSHKPEGHHLGGVQPASSLSSQRVTKVSVQVHSVLIPLANPAGRVFVVHLFTVQDQQRWFRLRDEACATVLQLVDRNTRHAFVPAGRWVLHGTALWQRLLPRVGSDAGALADLFVLLGNILCGVCVLICGPGFYVCMFVYT